ncbi:MAG: hypothetical protein NC218_07510 [Acetobacter sp.]|nr:hypothetical protein [Acetobacter sp.]
MARYDNRHGQDAAANVLQKAMQATQVVEFDESAVNKMISKYAELRTRVAQVSTVNRELTAATKQLQSAQNENASNVNELQIRVDTLRNRLIELGSSEDTATQDTTEMNAQFRAIATVLTQLVGLSRDGSMAFNEMGQAAQSAGVNGERLTAAEIAQAQAAEQLKAKIQELKGATGDWASNIVSLGTTVGQFAMAWNALQSLNRVFTD